MKINGKHFRTIWLSDDGWSVNIIDQTRLPHSFEVVTLRTLDDAARAISDMQVRGAPLIGATAAYGVCLGLREDRPTGALDGAIEELAATRPTAGNRRWALSPTTSGSRPHTLSPGESATTTWRPVAASASTVWQSSRSWASARAGGESRC
jgi:methylthioribose-1-phosphate isomerase